ncbi:MAG TPA: hypothetical protein DCR95_11545 [Desulfobacter sp.]|nr:hypothetical protein [Desulfobacter sp.]
MSEEQTKYDCKSRYYNAGGIETLDIIRAKLTPEQYEGFLMGNAIKYLCRANFKANMDRDLEKAATYSKWLSELPSRTNGEAILGG